MPYQQGMPLNANGEVVIGFGTGGSTVVNTLPIDFIPTDSQGRLLAYLDVGDTSKTFAARFYGDSTLSINTTDTVLNAFEVEEAGNVNVQKISTNVVKILKTVIVTGTLSFNLTTTGSDVTLQTWIEGSSDNVNWNCVPNSLRQSTVSTASTVNVGDVVTGLLPAGSYFRFMAKRIGGNSASLHSDTITTDHGNVTQRAIFLRVYGI